MTNDEISEGLSWEDGHVRVVSTVSDLDGRRIVQIDILTRDPVRVNVNDGELATVFQSGDRIVLPEHAHEFEYPSSPAPVAAHQEIVHVSWTEGASYSKDVIIDVPDEFDGDLNDLVQADDCPLDAEGVPAGFRTGWLDRIDFTQIQSITMRDIDVAPVGARWDVSFTAEQRVLVDADTVTQIDARALKVGQTFRDPDSESAGRRVEKIWRIYGITYVAVGEGR